MRNKRTAAQVFFFIFVRPFFPFVQWISVSSGMVPGVHTYDTLGRQPFVVGYLEESFDLAAIKKHLKTQGFFTNRVALSDEGQALSMRRLCATHPTHQFHLRIFDDGEVRGH